MTLDLSYYWEGGREFCDDNEWDGKKKKKKNLKGFCCSFLHKRQREESARA